MASRSTTSSEVKPKLRESRRGRREDLRRPTARNLSSSRSCRETSSRGRPSTKRRESTRDRPRQIVSTPAINCVELLKELQSADPGDVISRLYDARDALGSFIGKKLSNDKIQLLVYTMSKFCQTEEFPQKADEIVTLFHEKRFLELSLRPWIAEWKTASTANDLFEKNIESTVLVLRRMLRQIPDSVCAVGATLLVLKTVVKHVEDGTIDISLEVSSSLSSLIEEHETLQRDSYEMRSRGKKDRRSPPEDFRCLPILPMPHELQKDFKPFLRANIVNGSYDNVHHYLDVHFRLLREDLIQPLREGIAEYREKLSPRKAGSQRMPRLQNIAIYENVCVFENTDDLGGIEYALHFEVEGKLRRIDWEQSKRLLSGNLLCLSPDNFQTLIFGVIKERDPKYLSEGFVEVSIEEMPVELLECPLTMAESPSYFEAYKYVLSSLQNTNQDRFPFLTYLVSVSKEGKLPNYVKDNPEITMDATSISQSTSGKRRLKSSQKINKINLSEDSDWPSKEQLGFDDSQMEAYKAALREEVCVIQGPPGTGKTFIGLKIVQTLLSYKNNWSKGEPLLVVCYTNHALDQFLEGILSFESKVIRLGSRSSSEKVKMLTIGRQIGPHTREDIRQLNSSEGPIEKTPEMIRHEQIIQSCTSNEILSVSALGQVMNIIHRQSLQYGHQNSNCILFWLFNCDEMYFKSKKTFHQMTHGFTRYQPYKNKGGRNYFLEAAEDNYGTVEDGDYDDNESDSGSDNDSMADTNNYGDVGGYFAGSVGGDGNDGMNRDKHDLSGQFFIPEAEFNDIPENKIPRGYKIRQFIQMKLSQSDAMTMREAKKIRDVWSLNRHQRWRLYMFWRNSFIQKIEQKLELLSEEAERREAMNKERRVERIRKTFRNFSVIGATTTGAAKHSALLEVLASPIVVVEEAAEILEAHVITALSPNCQHLILIGDHQQLRPSPEVYKLCKYYKFDVSLFERLVINGMPCHRLSTQHRMKPEISRLLKIHEDFYPGLIDHDMVTHYENIRGVESNLYFVEHTRTEEHNDDNKSRSNRHEATFLFELYKYLLKQGYSPSQTTILTAYRGQVRTFKNIMGERFTEVRVCPIDNFQGEENDIILFSFVRSNEEGSIGFLKVSNRICVALSRARKGLYCIGNFQLMATQNTLWKTIVDDLRSQQCIGTQLQLVCRNHPETFTKVSVKEDFKKVPDGGCSQTCDVRLSCGHTCPKKCHPEDREHKKIFCKKPCEKIMCEQQHKCPLKCGEDCGDKCNEIVEYVCPNMHKPLQKCYQKSCQARCEKMLPCGHQCKNKCSELCPDQCPEIVQKVLPCTHHRMMKCFQNPEEVKCQGKCDRELPCGHPCAEKCSNPCTKSCNETVQAILPCGHEQTFKCYVGAKNVLCKAKCDKQLECGHPCNTICSRPCTKSCEHMVEKEIPCGHLQFEKCHIESTKVTCQWKCEKTLPCGHPCHEKCSQTCTTKCKHIVTKTLSCGHVTKAECHKKPICQIKVSKTFDQCGHTATVACSASCPLPCGTQLGCGHICGGTCGECKNGASHVKCKQPCHNGCWHSRRTQLCGDICKPCVKPCTWKCPHASCTLKCGEECNRDPCNKSCRRRLRCRHRCTGLCGEPCPPLCRVCNKTWISWFLGRKNNPHTRFIYLLDCGHVVEEKEMDKLMSRIRLNGDVVQFPQCPWCATPIRFNPRYQNKLRKIWNRRSLKGQPEDQRTRTRIRTRRPSKSRR